MKHNTYTDEQVAGALVAVELNRGNLKKTSRQTKIPRQTLAHWSGRIPAHPQAPRSVPPQTMTEVRKQLKEQWKDVADASVETLREMVERLQESVQAGGKVTASDVYRMSLASGISTDKLQLLSGGPTSRSETVWDVLVRASGTPELPDNGTPALPVLEGEAIPVSTPDKPQDMQP